MIFVFGSNLAGKHGAGAAKAAYEEWEAEYGVGAGPTGRAYAIPTLDEKHKRLPIPVIAAHVDDFILYARKHSELYFIITRVGCGIAGFTDAEMAPLFEDAPDNCHIPMSWVYALVGGQ